MKTLRTTLDSKGFSAVELIIVLVVLVGVAGTGYAYMKMKNNATPAATTTTTTTQTASSDVPSAPQIKSNSDLDTALNTVNSVNLDASSSDSSQLGSQSSNF